MAAALVAQEPGPKKPADLLYEGSHNHWNRNVR
jgi:hypothetical protein